MKKKLMVATTTLLALSLVVGCGTKTKSSSVAPNTSAPDASSSADTSKPSDASSANTSSSAESSNPSSSSSVAPKKHTVTFDLNYAGAPAITPVQVEDGDYVDEPTEPAREKFYFNGWYLTQDASDMEFEFVTTPIKSDITLYADWLAACDVTFYLNEPGKEQAVYKKETVKAGSLVTQPEDPKIKGYAFKGWFNTADCNEGDEFAFSSRIRADKAAYAKWSEPDWKAVEAAIESFSNFIPKALGVKIPQFPNSDYVIDDKYSDCLIVKGPDQCIAEYKPILEAAGYTVDEDKNLITNDYYKIEYQETEKDGFEMNIFIAGSGEDTKFNPLPYQVGTQQNYIGLPKAVTDLFVKFETYKTGLQGGGAAALVNMYLDAKPENSTLTDEQYWTSKVNGMLTALKSSGYNSGRFTNTGGLYFYDAAYLTMNQIENYSESAPLVVQVLSYSYSAQYNCGISYNAIEPAVFANAVQAAPFKTTASLDVDLSALAPTYATNGKNFIIEYDAGTYQGEDYIELDVYGIKSASYAPLNALAAAVLNSLDQESGEWDLMTNSNQTQTYAKYYAYHYGVDENGKKKADAKLTFGYSSASTANSAFGIGPLVFEIVLTPAESTWNAEFVAEYFKKQALGEDKAGLPAYTGDFALVENATSKYGDGLDIFMLYTNPQEAVAYKDLLLTAENGYTLVKADDENGQYLLRSASTNFEVQLYVREQTFEIYVDAAPVKEREFNDNAFDELNGVLNARSGFEIPAAARAVLTATYTNIAFSSYFDFEDGAGYSVVNFVSNVASVEDGQTNPVSTDVTALTNYYLANGFTSKSNGTLVNGGTTIKISMVDPTTDVAFYMLRVVVMGNVPVPLDGGHTVKVNDTTYVADNGDAFLISMIGEQIKAKYPSMENQKLPSFYATLDDPTIYEGTTLSIFTNLESYTIYYYNLANELVDTTSDKSVLKAAAEKYIGVLKAAGFVHAYFTALQGSPEGYWNSTSGEFVTVGVDSTNSSVNVRVFFIGSQYRNTVQLAND